MPDHYLHLLAKENYLFGKPGTHIRSINIAIYSFERQATSGNKLVSYLKTSKITGMPDLIAIRKMVEYPIIEKAMSI